MINADFARYSHELKDHYPKFKLVPKEQSLLMEAIDGVLSPFIPSFMTEVTTTIGYSVYMPMSYIGTRDGYATLRHEAVHIADYHKYSLLFSLSYLFLLPTILTFRAFWEWRAYVETMRVELELTGAISQELIDWIASIFCNGMYIWMFPFKQIIISKLQNKRLELINERNQNRKIPSTNS